MIHLDKHRVEVSSSRQLMATRSVSGEEIVDYLGKALTFADQATRLGVWRMSEFGVAPRAKASTTEEVPLDGTMVSIMISQCSQSDAVSFRPPPKAQQQVSSQVFYQRRRDLCTL
jgi:hypothetical protein